MNGYTIGPTHPPTHHRLIEGPTHPPPTHGPIIHTHPPTTNARTHPSSSRRWARPAPSPRWRRAVGVCFSFFLGVEVGRGWGLLARCLFWGGRGGMICHSLFDHTHTQENNQHPRTRMSAPVCRARPKKPSFKGRRRPSSLRLCFF